MSDNISLNNKFNRINIDINDNYYDNILKILENYKGSNMDSLVKQLEKLYNLYINTNKPLDNIDYVIVNIPRMFLHPDKHILNQFIPDNIMDIFIDKAIQLNDEVYIKYSNMIRIVESKTIKEYETIKFFNSLINIDSIDKVDKIYIPRCELIDLDIDKINNNFVHTTTTVHSFTDIVVSIIVENTVMSYLLKYKILRKLKKDGLSIYDSTLSFKLPMSKYCSLEEFGYIDLDVFKYFNIQIPQISEEHLYSVYNINHLFNNIEKYDLNKCENVLFEMSFTNYNLYDKLFPIFDIELNEKVNDHMIINYKFMYLHFVKDMYKKLNKTTFIYLFKLLTRKNNSINMNYNYRTYNTILNIFELYKSSYQELGISKSSYYISISKLINKKKFNLYNFNQQSISRI